MEDITVSAQIREKEEKLKEILRGYGSVAVAFSSGVDSTFLLDTAVSVLGQRAVAVTAISASFPGREREEAEKFCRERGIHQIFVDSEEIDIPGFRENPVNRCYLCKRALFSKIREVTKAEGIAEIAEGSNMDDNGDYRPGLIAVAELHVKSPLREAGLYKNEIRALSRERGLPTWSKPSFACLASRFVYGETISEKNLSMVDRAEQCLLDLGFAQVRVRVHQETVRKVKAEAGAPPAEGAAYSERREFLARIEVFPEEIARFSDPAVREKVDRTFREIGFDYVTLDLRGYRTGSMNEVL